ncbi:MAG TPA: DUF6624 domain-containing protein [Acidimicrobiales bacterium]
MSTLGGHSTGGLRAELLAMVERGRAAFDAVEELTKADPVFAAELARRGNPGVPLALLAWDDAPEVFSEMLAIDRSNSKRFVEIVAEHGWPGVSLVGEDGAEAAWELAMHADTEQAARRKWLPLVDDAAVRGEVSEEQARQLRTRIDAVDAFNVDQ